MFGFTWGTHEEMEASSPAVRPFQVYQSGKALSERDPDADLVTRVGAGDPLAVRALVANKLPRLIALAARMLGDHDEAADVAQEAFVRIWKQAPTWRTGEAKFGTWLHRVALNLCYDRLCGRRERTVDDPHAMTEPALDPAGASDQQREARTRDQRVRAALAALPVWQREALVLTYCQELLNLEAAGLLGISVDALESLLARARRSLRAQLAGAVAGKDSVRHQNVSTLSSPPMAQTPSAGHATSATTRWNGRARIARRPIRCWTKHSISIAGSRAT